MSRILRGKKTINVKLLNKVKAHILEEPRRFFMGDYMEKAKPGTEIELDGISTTMPDCGTAACIGGWALILSKKNPNVLPWKKAKVLLGLSAAQADRLMLVTSWPDKLCFAYLSASTMKQRVRVAAKRIDHFIKTDGDE